MYRKYPQNQGKSSKLKAKGISQQQLYRMAWIGVMILVSFVFSLLSVTKVNAATHTANDAHSALVQDKYARTVGYQTSWVENLSGMAEEAFNDDEYPMAKRIWKMLAEQGNADAAYKLGMLYDTGVDGVEQDAAEAAQWYLQAAQKGHLHAQHNLAVAYASGDGVEMDISKALVWWKRAAQTGNSDSQYNLGIVYAMGVHGVKKNLDKAKKWWRKAAMKGDPMAQYNLGTIYANGEDVRSYCEATRWWEKSARKGVEQASWALEIIKTRQDYQSCW